MKEKGLPKNRLDVFLEIFQMSWRTLAYISLFLAIFILPIILVVLFSEMANINILTNINSSNQDEIIKATYEYYYQHIFTIIYLFPCFIIASFGLAGCFNIMRRIVWLEQYDFIDCFKNGIKGNVSKIIFNAIILTIVYAMGVLVYLYLLFNRVESLTMGLIIAFAVIVGVFLLNMVFVGYAQMNVYNNNLLGYVKNNFIFSFVSYFKSFLVLLLALILVSIGFLFEFVVGIVIVYSFYALIGFGYAILLFTLNSHNIFDKLINKEQYPNIYRKGLS